MVLQEAGRMLQLIRQDLMSKQMRAQDLLIQRQAQDIKDIKALMKTGGKPPVSAGSKNAPNKHKLGGAAGSAPVKKTALVNQPAQPHQPVHTPIHCLRCGALDAHSTPNCDFVGTDAQAAQHRTKGKKERDKKRAQKRAKKRADR
eukprot:SAG11_NODE_4819_length_1754_cov_4.054985_2_plen_145_part_00